MLIETNLPNLIYRGKVRDTYDLGEGAMLMVATDRISAFDVVLPTGIPNKGLILSHMSAFWFDKTAHIIPNHLIDMANEPEALPVDSPVGPVPPEISRQAMVVVKAKRVDVECIVRGYLAGSAWGEYQTEGTIFGKSAPKGLQEGELLPEPIFTPTTKSETGHDENISIESVKDMVGSEVTCNLEEKSIALYTFARDYAATKGIILADTKLEFGFIGDDLILIDEIFTPDSSRFWDMSGYRLGSSPPNFDKQFVRDWLTSQGWDKNPPAPPLPDEVVEKTSKRYSEAYERLVEKPLVTKQGGK